MFYFLQFAALSVKWRGISGTFLVNPPVVCIFTILLLKDNLIIKGCYQAASSIKHCFFNTSNKGKYTGNQGGGGNI